MVIFRWKSYFDEYVKSIQREKKKVKTVDGENWEEFLQNVRAKKLIGMKGGHCKMYCHVAMKFAPSTSLEVERIFSKWNNCWVTGAQVSPWTTWQLTWFSSLTNKNVVSLNFVGGKKTYIAHFAIDLFSVVGCCCCCFQIIIIINAIFRSYFNAIKVIFSMSYFSITSYLTGSVYKTRRVKITK